MPDVLAAVDLGSNSFHMVVARVVGNAPSILDRLREQVQLGAGLDEISLAEAPAVAVAEGGASSPAPAGQGGMSGRQE